MQRKHGEGHEVNRDPRHPHDLARFYPLNRIQLVCVLDGNLRLLQRVEAAVQKRLDHVVARHEEEGR